MTTQRTNEWDHKLEALRRAWLNADPANKQDRLRVLNQKIRERNREERA